MKADEAVNHQLTPDGKFALLIVACEIPVFLVVLVAGSPLLALSISTAIGISMIALRATWPLHNRSWYWLASAIAVAVEVFVNLHVPWANHAFRGAALLPLAILDYLIVYGCIRLVERTMHWADAGD